MRYRTRALRAAVRGTCKAGMTATAFAALAVPHTALAQAQPAQPQMRVMDEVVITARRRAESAQTVPISVNALSGSALETFKIDNMDDLQSFDPSFTVSAASGRPNAPVYSLRGVRPTEAIYGQDPTVAIYLADVVLSPAKGSNLGMYDLESVQVLKGPQGTLFGRNTTGGAILMTPRRPDHAFGGDLMVGFGNYGRQEAQFGVDLPVADNFAMRLSGKFEDVDGYQRNVAPGPYYGDRRGGGETRSVRLSAVWDITDRVENYTILTWDEIDLNGRTGVLQAVNPDSAAGQVYSGVIAPSLVDALERAQGRDLHEVESDMRERSDVEVWGVINTTTVDLSDTLTFKGIAAYRDLKSTEIVDLDATAIPDLLTSDPQDTTLEHASVELQLLGSAFDDRLDWVTGLYWYYEDGIEDSPGNAMAAVNPNNPFMQTAVMENHSYSLFAQGNYRFTDQWSLTGGVRWTYDDKKLDVSTRTPNGCEMFDAGGVALPNDNCWFRLSESFDQTTGTVSLSYTPNDDTLLYIATRYGYRAGGFNARAAQPHETEPFDAETVLDLEAGLKRDWQLGNWQMRSNIAVYHQWYDDIQRTVNVLTAGGVPGSTVENAAEATVFGVEIEQEISPTDNLTFKFQYAYTDPEYDSWTDPASGRDLSSTPFYFTPEHAFTVTALYTYPMQGNAGILDFGISASWQDDVWINSLNTIAEIEDTPREVRHAIQQEDYWLVNASVAWNDIMGSNVDVSAYVKNLTNTEYSVGGIQLYPSFGISTKVFGEPRTYGMQVRYRF